MNPCQKNLKLEWEYEDAGEGESLDLWKIWNEGCDLRDKYGWDIVHTNQWIMHQQNEYTAGFETYHQDKMSVFINEQIRRYA